MRKTSDIKKIGDNMTETLENILPNGTSDRTCGDIRYTIDDSTDQKTKRSGPFERGTNNPGTAVLRNK